MNQPITRSRLKQHLTYSWWKYVLLLVIGFFAVDLAYSVTAPRVPEEKKIEFYVYGYTDDAPLADYLNGIRESRMPEMEEISALALMPDESYGPMQLMAYMAAHQGDIYVLPRDNFLGYASEGSFVALENDAELMALFTDAGVDLQRGWRKDTNTGETHLYGIPVDKLPSLRQYAYCENGFASVFIANGNDENVMKFFRILCGDMIRPLPEELTNTPEAEGTQSE